MEARPITIEDFSEESEKDSRGIPVPKRLAHQKASLAVVTGASSGIGADTVRAFREQGWQVIAVARRANRLAELVKETGCLAFSADLTVKEHIDALKEYADSIGEVRALVNNAGGAIGADKVEDAKVDDWRKMFELNMLSTLEVTNAFLPDMKKRGGDLVFVTSTAAIGTYPGGGGYVASKHGAGVIARTLRLELAGYPVRIIEICPGMVQTAEFSYNRVGEEKAEALYDKARHPLIGEDVAEAIVWTVSLPPHMNIDQMIIRPVEQPNFTDVVKLESPLE